MFSKIRIKEHLLRTLFLLLTLNFFWLRSQNATKDSLFFDRYNDRIILALSRVVLERDIDFLPNKSASQNRIIGNYIQQQGSAISLQWAGVKVSYSKAKDFSSTDWIRTKSNYDNYSLSFETRKWEFGAYYDVYSHQMKTVEYIDDKKELKYEEWGAQVDYFVYNFHYVDQLRSSSKAQRRSAFRTLLSLSPNGRSYYTTDTMIFAIDTIACPALGRTSYLNIKGAQLALGAQFNLVLGKVFYLAGSGKYGQNISSCKRREFSGSSFTRSEFTPCWFYSVGIGINIEKWLFAKISLERSYNSWQSDEFKISDTRRWLLLTAGVRVPETKKMRTLRERLSKVGK